MKIIKSIKHQALILIVGFTLGLALVYLSLTVITAFTVEDAIIHKLLKMEAEYIQRNYVSGEAIPKPRQEFIRLYDNKESLPQFVKDNLNNHLNYGEVFTPTEDHYHFKKITLEESKKIFLLAEVSSLLSVTKSPDIFILFLVGALLSLLLATYISYKITSHTVNPILELEQAVRFHHQSESGYKLPTLNYELGYLSQTLQASFDSLNDAIVRERDFATDVSHELRTPLTIINNTLVLAEHRGIQDEDLENLVSACSHMQNTVNVLLAIARKDHLVKSPCNVTSMIEQATLDCSSGNRVFKNIDIDIPCELTLMADPNLFRLLLINLISNAIFHSSDGSLAVSYQHERLIFANKIAEEVSSNIVNPGVKGDQSLGVGQGLYLVSRIIRSFNWSCTISQVEDSFRFEIIPEISP